MPYTEYPPHSLRVAQIGPADDVADYKVVHALMQTPGKLLSMPVEHPRASPVQLDDLSLLVF